MEKFARLLNTSHGQVLFLIDWDNDEGGYRLNTLIERGGVRATTSVVFAAKETALEKMESFEESNAEQLAGTLYQMLEAPSQNRQIIESTLLN